MTKPKAKPKRKRGPSRLEKLLEASIRQEIQTKKLWKELRQLVYQVDVHERIISRVLAQQMDP